uniref:Uncharacterized protein n=1 Tax=Physcomitrium patens TaxID=3218 RepID=A0A2K1J8P4_PHYPA|nr:hypothetical protein PHYPA_021004 [Physcomitrium patens]
MWCCVDERWALVAPGPPVSDPDPRSGSCAHTCDCLETKNSNHVGSRWVQSAMRQNDSSPGSEFLGEKIMFSSCAGLDTPTQLALEKPKSCSVRYTLQVFDEHLAAAPDERDHGGVFWMVLTAGVGSCAWSVGRDQGLDCKTRLESCRCEVKIGMRYRH